MTSVIPQSFWKLHKSAVKLLGLETALFLTDLIARKSYFARRQQLTHDGFFFVTVEDIESDTLLSKYHQSKAKRMLQQHGLLKAEMRRVCPFPGERQFFSLNEAAIELLYSGNWPKNESDSAELKPAKQNALKNDVLENERASSSAVPANASPNQALSEMPENNQSLANGFSSRLLCLEAGSEAYCNSARYEGEETSSEKLFDVLFTSQTKSNVLVKLRQGLVQRKVYERKQAFVPCLHEAIYSSQKRAPFWIKPDSALYQRLLEELIRMIHQDAQKTFHRLLLNGELDELLVPSLQS